MLFEWDQKKNKKNLTKHGISFQEAKEIFQNIRLTSIDKRKKYGERREVSLGLLEDIPIIVIHTKRQQKIRIISARKANKKERRKFYEYLKKQT
jgi:uncharacterized protein